MVVVAEEVVTVVVEAEDVVVDHLEVEAEVGIEVGAEVVHLVEGVVGVEVEVEEEAEEEAVVKQLLLNLIDTKEFSLQEEKRTR